MRSRWYCPLLFLPVILLAACSDEPVAPRAVPDEAPRFSAAAARGLPAPVSNRVRYRNEGQKPSTGRAGSASLTARALLGRDNRVELDITTGSLEDLDRRTGPGNLEKIQLKVYDLLGNHVSTSNHNRLRNGGFARYELADLPRGSRIQVQANVRGIDPNRNDVVTVTDAVKLRPDLAARELLAPLHALPNVPVSIGAVVQELNGDVGARADCVLRVDGVEVDRARGIWVDAGSTVSCAFSHSFPSTGSKTLSVAVTGVTPGDYDLSNNEVSGAITIAYPTLDEFSVEGRAWDLRQSFFQISRSSWRWSEDNGATFFNGSWDFSDSTDGRHQWAAQWGSTGREIEFPMSVQLRHASNGSDILDESIADLEAETTDSWHGYRATCAERVITSENSGDLWFRVCSGFDTFGGQQQPFTRIDQTRWAGEVTYFGHRYYSTWYGDGQCVDTCYASNWNDTRTTGMPLPTLGSDYTLQVVLTKDGLSSHATITVPLLPANSSSRFPEVGESCYSWDHGASWDFYSGTACSASGSSEQGVRGYAYHRPAP